MKTIQKGLIVKTPIFFSIFLIGSLFFLYSIFTIKGSTIKWNVGMLLAPLLFYITYHYGYIYEFNQRKLTVKKLFGLLGENIYFFHDIKHIEYSYSWKGYFDTIHMYFTHDGKDKKITIYIFQQNLDDVKAFLYFNIDNMREISKTIYRKFS